MSGQLQRYVPNMMTFASMGCGLASIISTGQDMLLTAGLLIMAGVILDTLDGFTARKLKVSSGFGTQLDSLVDIVSFGVAPIVLALEHLQLGIHHRLWILPAAIVYLCAGAFRLARFNLEPIKQGKQEPTGLTITQAGFTITLAVLSDLSRADYFLPVWIYLMLFVVLSYLMVSRIKFPTFSWYFPFKWIYGLYILLILGLFLCTSFYTMILVICLGSVAASIFRHFVLSGWFSSGAILNE